VGAAAALVVAQAGFVLVAFAPVAVEVRAALGVVLVCGVAAGVARVGDVPRHVAVVLGVGAAAVVAVDRAQLDAAATPLEALAWAAAGVAFAVVLDAPPLVVALPLFVAAVDLVQSWGAAAGPPAGAPGDALVLTLPDGSGRLTAPEAVFLGAFAAYARRFGLRERLTLAAMAAALVVAVGWAPLPALALLSAGALLPNVDRAPALLRGEAAG
jgi:hypothetical protein